MKRLSLLAMPCALWSSAALAQSGPCFRLDTITINAPYYNALSASDYIVTVTGTATRLGSDNRFDLSLVLERGPTDTTPWQLFVIDDDGSAAIQDLFKYPPAPAPRAGLNDAGEIDLDFKPPTGSNNVIYSRTFTLQLRMPPNMTLWARQTDIWMNVKYLCDYTFVADSSGILSSGFHLIFPVATTIQGSLVGSELDFGEIGNLNTSTLGGVPAGTKERSRNIRVVSSGPYELKIKSQNGWRMTAGGAPTVNANERVDYSYQVLGQTMTPAQRTFTTKICHGTIDSGPKLIPMKATLLEGGVGKMASPNYRDIVTITLTPLHSDFGFQAQYCPP